MSNSKKADHAGGDNENKIEKATTWKATAWPLSTEGPADEAEVVAGEGVCGFFDDKPGLLNSKPKWLGS